MNTSDPNNMRSSGIIILIFFAQILFAQKKETFDLVTYTIPAGWQNKSADYERPYFVSGDVKENLTGKKVHVVLFQRGRSGWVEIIASDKNTFIQNFSVDILKVDYYADSEIWAPLQKLGKLGNTISLQYRLLI